MRRYCKGNSWRRIRNKAIRGRTATSDIIRQQLSQIAGPTEIVHSPDSIRHLHIRVRVSGQPANTDDYLREPNANYQSCCNNCAANWFLVWIRIRVLHALSLLPDTLPPWMLIAFMNALRLLLITVVCQMKHIICSEYNYFLHFHYICEIDYSHVHFKFLVYEALTSFSIIRNSNILFDSLNT